MAARRFLRAVTGGGSSGSAATAGMAAPQDDFGFGFESDRPRPRDVVIPSVSGRRRRLLIGLALPIVTFILVIKLSGSQTDPTAPPAVRNSAPADVGVDDPTPQSTIGAGFRRYALEVSDLEGLPPDAAPGTRLEIWVTWEPPLTKAVKVQRLIRMAQLERIVPPVVPEAPGTALLSVRAEEIPDLLYGDRFGALSVSILPDA